MEITDYAHAQRFMLHHYGEKTRLSELLMINLHYELLREAKPEFAGHVRVYGEDVTAGGEDVGYAEGAYVDQEIEKLFIWYDSYNPVQMSIRQLFEFAVEFKYRLLRIHPFNDGNGRISRLLMNYVLLTNHMFPFVVQIGDRKDYMNAVIATQQGDDLTYYYLTLARIYVRELKEYVKYREPGV